MAAPASASTVMILFGIVYLLIGIVGITSVGENGMAKILGFLHVNAADNYLHIALGIVIALAGMITRRRTVTAWLKLPWGRSNKSYGIAGNSFVATVEFCERLKAKSVITGGSLLTLLQNISMTRLSCFSKENLRISYFIKRMYWIMPNALIIRENKVISLKLVLFASPELFARSM